MDKVWIITVELGCASIFIEEVFDSYELAHMAAEDIWRRCEPTENSYLWKRGEICNGDFCKMTIWNTDQETQKDTPFATIKIEPYAVWH